MSYYVNYVSIKPRSLVIFSRNVDYVRSAKSKPPPLQSNRDKGLVLSNRSRAKLRTALDILIYSAKWKTVFVKKTNTNFRYKVNFITLTLPSKQVHSDKEIVAKCLSPFLEAWAKRRKGLLYVYKAEVQENGNIHFHIVSNAFYHYLKLRKDWNRYTEKLGYVSRSKSDDPNSTDVHALDNKKDIAQYLTSYMSKKDTHSKTLKRYLRIYKKKLLQDQNLYFTLPKHYFDHIKRKIETNSWNASRLIKGFKATFEYENNPISQKMCNILLQQKAFLKKDYCHILFYELNGFEMFPEFKKRFDLLIKDIVEVQQEAVINETIEAL